jgi:omega-amidase
MIREKQNYYNRLLWARPDGSLAVYDKKHLFSVWQEKKKFIPPGTRA